MAYVINKFGETYATATALPTLDGSQPQGAGPVDSSLVRLPGGGAFDWRGSAAARVPVEVVRLDGYVVAADAATMETTLSGLKALRGVRSKLWRSNGTTQHWRYARCLEVASDMLPGVPVAAQVRMTFELDATPWYGAAVTATVSLTTVPKSLALSNGGNLAVTDVLVTVTPPTNAVTRIIIGIAGVSEIRWDGSCPVGSSLVIDCGKRAVKVGGLDAYGGFQFTSNHKISDWLRLAPGNNTVSISRVGGSWDTEVKFEYSVGWS